MGWTRRTAAISVLLVLEEQRKRAGQRVVQLREAQGWSQETLAGKAGVSAKTVSRFENGVHEGRNETVRKLAKALKVNEIDITGPPPAPLGLTVDAPVDQVDIAGHLAAIDARLDRLEALLDRVFNHRSEQGSEIIARLDSLEQAVLDGTREINDETAARLLRLGQAVVRGQSLEEAERDSQPTPEPRGDAANKRAAASRTPARP